MPDAPLPCPHCGSKEARHGAKWHANVFVWCQICKAEGPISDSEAGAVAAWNRRTSPPCPPDLTTQADAEIAILRSDLRAAREERDALREEVAALRAAQAATVVQIPDPCRPVLTMTPAPKWVQGGGRVPALVIGRGAEYVLVVTDGDNTVRAVPASEVK